MIGVLRWPGICASLDQTEFVPLLTWVFLISLDLHPKIVKSSKNLEMDSASISFRSASYYLNIYCYDSCIMERNIDKWCRKLQDSGRAESSFARYDVSIVVKKFLSIKLPDLIAPPGMEIIDFFEASLPSWISEDEVEYFASNFRKSGFTGPLNYYRMMDL